MAIVRASLRQDIPEQLVESWRMLAQKAIVDSAVALQKQINLEVVDMNGDTALIKAAHREHWAIVRFDCTRCKH